MQDIITEANAIGIQAIAIDEDFDFSTLPPFAQLFPESQEPRKLGPEHTAAADIWNYLSNNTTLGESMIYFDKASKDQTILDIAYLIRRAFP